MADARFVSDLQRLAKPLAGVQALSGARPLAEIPDKTGLGQRSTGEGIAGPLVEEDYTARIWHPDQVASTTDGVFSFVVRCLKSVTLFDANGREVPFRYADKPQDPAP